MADLTKLAERILNQVESHAKSVLWIMNQDCSTYPLLRARIVGEIEGLLRELPRDAPQPTGSVHKYRVWFDTYYYSLGFIVGTLPENAINIEGVTKEGIVIEAYTAADVVEQAKFEIHALTYNLAGGPYQTVIRKIAPDRGAEREVASYGATVFKCLHFPPCRSDAICPDNPVKADYVVCMHLPPCRGQCEGDPVKSDQHG